MSALAALPKSRAARPVVRHRGTATAVADSLIVEFASATDVSDGVRRVAALLSRTGVVAGAEWWAPAEGRYSFVLRATEGRRVGQRRAIPIGPAGTLVVVGARSGPSLAQALDRLIPLLRRRWTEERLSRHASLLARRVEALEDFATLVAHELKAPLQAALLADDATTGAAAALALVDSVLEAVRCDDSLDDSAAPAACLTAALDDLDPVDAQIVRDVPDRFPLPSAALRLVLRNVLRNSVAAGATRIFVWGSSASERSTLVVDDDGVGLDGSAYAAGERLGLSLCDRVLARHGGQLELSARPSGGTRAILSVSPR